MKAGIDSPGVLLRQGWTASDIRRRLMCAYQEHLAEMSAYRKAERKAKAGKK